MWDQMVNECVCMYSCLKLISKWSDANPGHFPLYILLEPKTSAFTEDSYQMFHDLDLNQLLLLEQQILEIFGEKVVTPDAMRNGGKSVQSVLNSMPSLKNFQGKIFFVLWEMGELRSMYRKNTNSLQGEKS